MNLKTNSRKDMEMNLLKSKFWSRSLTLYTARYLIVTSDPELMKEGYNLEKKIEKNKRK